MRVSSKAHQWPTRAQGYNRRKTQQRRNGCFLDRNVFGVQLHQADAAGKQNADNAEAGEEIGLAVLQEIPQAVEQGEGQRHHDGPLGAQPVIPGEFGQDQCGNSDIDQQIGQQTFLLWRHSRNIKNPERIRLSPVTTQSTCTVTVRRPTVF